MFDLSTMMVLIPALPLAAAVLTALLGKKVLGGASHWPALVATALSLLLSLALLSNVHRAAQETAESETALGYEHVVSLWTWVTVEDAYDGGAMSETAAARGPFDLSIDIALRADPLTAIMLATVTFVALLVIIYSIGYMHGDPGYWRFFAYVALFVFSMTMLVSSSNFLLLFVFWEAVGVCSYLLIGFWYEKPSAAAAGMKAFLVNRIGDFGFALGVFLIWITYGTLNFHDTVVDGVVQTSGVFGASRLASGEFVAGGVGLAIGLLLFLGACGKSAQFPLHVWLPDAMEGPTPVSALIHAATMVTAGVYMVARSTPLFLAAPDAQVVVACIGGFTALLVGLIALTQTDLKRILAYSTVSQLGYMFLGMGVGTLAGISAGMFHLFTHAFFKALLFLGAGSVMHAMGGVIDINRFGGLRRLMPKTHLTFLVGCIALAGIAPLSGFWSKDLIVAAVHDRAQLHDDAAHIFEWLYYVALFAALLTAFYTFRAFFRTFYGKEEIPVEAGHHAHESPPTMWVPLAILAVLAAGVGLYFEITHGFADFLSLTPSLAYPPLVEAAHPAEFHLEIAAISTLIALAGTGLAAYLYLGDQSEVNLLTRLMRSLRLYQLSYGKFFLDEVYNVAVVWPARVFATLSYWIDRRLIDGLVDWIGRLPVVMGASMRSLQTGMVQFYALAMVLGLLVLLGTLLR